MSDQAVLPVVRWGTSVAPEHHVGLLRLAILTVQGQTEDQAQETPIFSLSPAQLRELAATFVQLAERLEPTAPYTFEVTG